MKKQKVQSKKELRVLALRAKGMTIKKIAEKVGLSSGGVCWYLNKF